MVSTTASHRISLDSIPEQVGNGLEVSAWKRRSLVGGAREYCMYQKVSIETTGSPPRWGIHNHGKDEMPLLYTEHLVRISNSINRTILGWLVQKNFATHSKSIRAYPGE